MGQGGEVLGRKGGLELDSAWLNHKFCFSPVNRGRVAALWPSSGFGRIARRLAAERSRHRRYQRPHEEGVIGGIDVGAQAVGFEFVRDHRPYRSDRRARQPLAQSRFTSVGLGYFDE